MRREELSVLLDVSQRTLQRWEHEGKLPKAVGTGRGNKATYKKVIISGGGMAIFPDRIKYIIWKPTGVLIYLDTGEILWRSPVPGIVVNKS